MTLRKKVISSVTWVLLLRYSTRAIDFLKYAIITRILLPSDIGNFVLATTIIITFEALSDTGFTFAFIQKRANIEKYAKTLWITSIARGAVITVGVFLTSWGFSWFFKSPQLLPLLLVLSVIPLIKGFQSPYVILYQKNLEFHKEFFYRIVPMLISSLASIALVLIFQNTMSLIISIVLGTVAETLFSFGITKTRFSYPFSFEKAKELFSYGKYLTAGSIFTLLITQVDSLFVGKFFGAGILAIYELAFNLANIVFSEITDMISRVAFPYFSHIQNKKERLQKAFTINMMVVTLPATIITLIFLIFPETILRVAFGPKYTIGASILQILSIYGLLRAVAGPTGPLFLALGRPHITTYLGIINFILLILLIYPLSQMFGLNGVALAMVLSYLLALPYLFYKLTYAFTNKRG